MPTATDIDNRPVAIGKWPRLRGSHNRNAAIISSNHALNRRNRAIANANSDNNDTSFERTGRPIGSPEEDEQSAKNWDEQSAKDSWSANASNGKHKDWCTLDNCISNCDDDSSNPCIDVLLNPELLQEFYGDKCKFVFSYSLFFRSFHVLVSWYFGHFSCVIFFPVFFHLAFQNVKKDYLFS